MSDPQLPANPPQATEAPKVRVVINGQPRREERIRDRQ